MAKRNELSRFNSHGGNFVASKPRKIPRKQDT